MSVYLCSSFGRSIDCKYFDFGNGTCPFGAICFYKVITLDYIFSHISVQWIAFVIFKIICSQQSVELLGVFSVIPCLQFIAYKKRSTHFTTESLVNLWILCLVNKDGKQCAIKSAEWWLMTYWEFSKLLDHVLGIHFFFQNCKSVHAKLWILIV